MKNKTSKILKYLVLVLFVLITIIIAVIIFLILKNDESNKNNNLLESNTIETEKKQAENNVVIDENIIMDSSNTNENTDNSIDQENVKSTLQKANSTRIYFLIKKCMKNYYNTYGSIQDYIESTEQGDEDNFLNLIDPEAIQDLNINKDTIINLYGKKELPRFNIDDIYEQHIDKYKIIYVVKYRIETDTGISNEAMFIKRDNKNETFSIYPYQYLQKHNYLNLKENDILQVQNLKDIEKNQSNMYDLSNISLGEVDCILELYKKFQFDLSFDLEHLYNTMNEKYRELSYSSFESFKNEMETTRNEITYDKIEKYSSTRNNSFVEFVGICTSGKRYIYSAKSLIDYNIVLDNYTTETLQYINAFNFALPKQRGKYCIDRIISAINDKKYKFVYDKLNLAQKSNYYPTYEEFENFIVNNFFNKNDFEIQENEKSISTNVYQYSVKISNQEDNSQNKLFTMVIYLEENGEFKVSIIK